MSQTLDSWIIEQEIAIATQLGRETAAAARHLAKMAMDIATIKRKQKERNERIVQVLRLGSPADLKCKCGGRLGKKNIQDDKQSLEIFGERYDLVCTKCSRVMYFPSFDLAWMGNVYYDAARALDRVRQSEHGGKMGGVSIRDMPIIFSLHQAAELYLKSLGSYDAAGEDDEDSELESGPAYDHRNHNLALLLEKTFQYLQGRLHRYRGTEGTSSVSELIYQICPKTSELARYGYLFKKDEYPDDEKWDEIEPSLLRLCKLLRGFARNERQL